MQVFFSIHKSIHVIHSNNKLKDNSHTTIPVDAEKASDKIQHPFMNQFNSVTQLCPTLCDPMDYSLPGSSVHGIFQARILEWVAMHSSRGSSLPKDQPASLMSPALAWGFFTTRVTREAPSCWLLLKNQLIV